MEREKLLFVYSSTINYISAEHIIAYLSGESIEERFRSGAEKIRSIVGGHDYMGAAGRILDRSSSMKVKVITYLDTSYPKKLKEMGYSPPVIFLKGDSSLLDGFAGSIVGSRKPTLSGLRFCRKIAGDIARNGITVVSGFAKGIDSCAHRAVLEEKGKTIAVFGSGVDVVYPRENEKLYHEIIDSGCIVSRYPPGTRPIGKNFPIRNGMIAALSDFICVVEAAKRSGSLITSRLGLEYGKEIFSVPGNPLYPQSEGTNELIKRGACPLTDISDILEAFGLSSVEVKRKRRRDDALSEFERKMLNNLRGEMSLEELAALMDDDVQKVALAMVNLEMKDIVMRGPAGYYCRCV